MPRLLAAFALAMLAANASACPALDALAERYGITFAGFLTPIPAVAHPQLSKDGRVVRLPLSSTHLVSDGFRHTVVFDAGTRKAWILRTGGFVQVREWYGPVETGAAKLEDCRIVPESERDYGFPARLETPKKS